MKLRYTMGVLVLLLAVSLVGALVYGKLGRKKPLRIDFVQKPLKEVYPDEVHLLAVSWNNKDKHGASEGAFVFMVEGKKFQVRAGDLTFVFEGSVIGPQVSGDTLAYVLPQQTFPAEEMGIVTVETTYHNSGEYLWEIGITESP
jgi:ABC-type uncharacterized transport system YnjBCD substrate-binding protein